MSDDALLVPENGELCNGPLKSMKAGLYVIM